MHVAASQCVVIIEVDLIRPKVFPDASHIPAPHAAAELTNSALAIRSQRS